MSSKKSNTSAVLVIGAGIAGMQAALDIANQNVQVYLVDRAPAIGGAMAKLDKTLPTNDCAVCIEAPKMVEVGRNDYIELITYADVVKVEGTKGNFTVIIEEHPRYVDMTKCTGCGACFEVCPIKIPNEFDHNMGPRGAIYRYFAQAVPNVATIDKTYCVNCGLCELVCVPEAIDHNAKAKLHKINIGAIILATGFEEYEPKAKTALGYGLYPNVITGMQFERLLSASGPTGGRVRRPSDGDIPKTIAWIQCVGARDVSIDQPYCSRVCCMWATKQAMIAKEHHPEISPHIFFMDVRAYGKGFEEYYQRGKSETGINYIRSRPAKIYETANNNLQILYENIDSKSPAELEVDLTVLSAAMKAPTNNTVLADILGVELDEYGFFKEKDPISAPLETTVEGIYVCGCSSGPKDIPDSVAQASGAASKALVAIRRNKIEKIKEELETVIEEEVSDTKDIYFDIPRIGVFICHCGRNIGGYLNVKRVTEYARTLPNVKFSIDNLFTCSDGTQTLIKDAIKKYTLNRVVVASCSPRTHETLFRTTCKEAGLNEYLFEMVNIRDQCSWVHSFEWTNATEKAKVLVSMGVAKASLLEPATRKRLKVIPAALIIGGGISGATAANDLAEMGFIVHLVEKKKQLGGLLQDLTSLFPTDRSAETILKEKMDLISKNSNINIYLGTWVEDVEGYVGNFTISLSGDHHQIIKVGTVIIATGAEEFKPIGYYGYSRHKNILTLYEFEKAFKSNQLPDKINNVFLISCVGSKEKEGEGHTYCCRIGCGSILKTAKKLSQRYSKSHIYILHQDFRVIEKTAEDYYREVRELPNVYFIRYKEDNKPNVKISENGISIAFHNYFTGENCSLSADLILLATPLVTSSDAKKLSQLFKITLGADGFFQEAHVKLRPLDFATEGIFVCGTAHSPKNVSDSIVQASGASARASIPMQLGYIMSEANVAVVDPTLCVGCGTCGKICPFEAICFRPFGSTNLQAPELKSEVNPVMCKGCGVCAVTCPAKAISIQGFTDLQILSQISEALQGTFPEEEPRIIGFCCNWCSYAGADLAGISRFQYPSNIRIIRVMCSGRIDPFFILWAFMEGAEGVFVSGCHPGDCHYITGNFYAQKRIEMMKKALSSIGVDPRRLTLEWVSASEGKRFSELVTKFTELIKSLTPYKPIIFEEKTIRGKIIAKQTI
ncbi:MAG: hydrogenase iron-sulfur subunit [Candidatus Hermodarchaeota archaeon]